MLTQVHPKLPMRSKAITEKFYVNQLGFAVVGTTDYPEYLMLERDAVQLHFFLYPELDPLSNDGQIYLRSDAVDALHAEWKAAGARVTAPEAKPWGQYEFAAWDPDNNLITVGN